MDDADDNDSETDGDEINAAACGWSWGCSVNPIVDAADVAAATLVLLISVMVAMVNTNVSNIFDVICRIFGALKLVRRWLNIVATLDIRSFLNPPANKRRKWEN